MTIQAILERVAQKRSISHKQLYRVLKVCKIKPVGLRTCPQQYPEDSPARVLTALGVQIVSMEELRSERKRAARVRVNGRRGTR